ncbi:ArsJ-associated glyceraldehyde-3-phosphate dehydrogenase [Reinekea sp.]|jgi:glyceraldehyde 3-phosphate dehydrogenase|uniref:ArsJ-associated glyceraldehyde-3-phosphate dehydrogenase n=1 Tax=Reinekea sp. TaxID=1970455 RepID=UPI002A822F53|nr:ArsJ-associated glyceraldehyde-3-phosphate dehydrogenase [Reinekea sp.]
MLRVGINGFGRMGRLTARVLLQQDDVQLVRINDPAGDCATLVHLYNFDSIHGRAPHPAQELDPTRLQVRQQNVVVGHQHAIADTDWTDCDLVIEASGQFKTDAALQPYRDQGVKVVVTAPVQSSAIPNIVMGINHASVTAEHHIITAASCTTNCLAPVVQVIHEQFGIKHGCMTTLHDITNTQTLVDAPHKDLRRARAAGMSLIPTTTGSAKAITTIFPELVGKLNGHAVRVPLLNASLTDCVFELQQAVTAEQVNLALQQAAASTLDGILGYEERPLVSIDYRTDPRSAIIDALSTMVINGTQLKLYVWYDNEWGYVNRTAELARLLHRL